MKRILAAVILLCFSLSGLCACGGVGIAVPDASAVPLDTASELPAITEPEIAPPPETAAETTAEKEEEYMIDMLSESCRYYCVSDAESALVMWRYNGKNIALSLRIKGVNRIFDVEKLYYNTDDAFTNDLSAYTLFINNGTDWLGPVIIKANQNADGDIQDKTHFTGGNHGYDNSGRIEGNTATGATRGLCIVIDGEMRDSFSGYCNSVKIRWTDFVQAANTTKADGTGREVLREEHTITFDGTDSGFDVTTRFIALEEMTFMRLYGLQCSANAKFKTVTFVGAKTNSDPQPITDGLKGDMHTTSLRLDGDVSVEFGVTDGLSDGTYQIGYTAFTSNNKSYLFLINPSAPKQCVLDQEESVYYVGWYRFE